MKRKQIPESENRLILLQAISLLESVNDLQLMEFLTETQEISWIDMRLGLSALLDQGYIVSSADPNGDLYSLTPEGEYLLRSFGQRIPQSRRKALEDSGALWRRLLRDVREAPAESTPTEEGCAIRLRLLEGSQTIFELRALVPGPAPTFLQRRWMGCAASLYRAAAMALTGPEDADAATDAPSPDTLCLEEHQDWRFAAGDSSFYLSMLLPDEAAAHRAACRWRRERGALEARLRRCMSEAFPPPESPSPAPDDG